MLTDTITSQSIVKDIEVSVLKYFPLAILFDNKENEKRQDNEVRKLTQKDEVIFQRHSESTSCLQCLKKIKNCQPFQKN